MRRIDIILTLIEQAGVRIERSDRNKFEVEFLARAKDKAYFLEPLSLEEASKFHREFLAQQMGGDPVRWMLHGGEKFVREPPQPGGEN